MKVVKPVPKLRFKQENGEELAEWKECTLGAITEVRKGAGLSKSALCEDGQYPCILYGELFTCYQERILEIRSFTNTKTCVVGKLGDVLMPTSDVTPDGLATASVLMLHDVLLGSDINVIRLTDQTDPVFFCYLLNYCTWEIIRLVSGTTVKHIYPKDIKLVRLVIPESVTEQQKIAGFLTAIDDRIESLEQKKKLLEQYKQGLMQKLFNRELRFKDEGGEEFAEWKTKRLEDLFQIKAGGDIDKEHFQRRRDEIYRYPVYANSEKLNGLHGYSDIYRVDCNCITVTGRGTLGIAIPRFEPFYPIVRLLLLFPILRCSLIFFSYAINRLNIFNESTGVPQLTAPQLRTYRISFPSLDEQQRIANFLTAIDHKIEMVNNQIEKTQSFKQGLLQQLFV
ncbi:MAG: restriction endonuclease subunit S [Gammaproteobacteria bacterium]|nr:restriction endonuclease subunit S [Gammaproteobacteria bacterium]MDE0252591.1 restriction endonuclease subunit S [Gammaproteobacteria bacterium]MDE0403553.1 restriction endonuclease subunit S [Gammaproteobacteria bacterium]